MFTNVLNVLKCNQTVDSSSGILEEEELADAEKVELAPEAQRLPDF